MAVYTLVSEPEIDHFLEGYALGSRLAFKAIAEGVENSNFLLQTEQGSFILTLFEKRVNPADLPFFLELTTHLSRKGLPTPLPIPSKDGQILQSLCGKPAVLVSFLKGLWPRRIHIFHCLALGQALAELHKATLDFALSRPNDLSLGAWPRLLEKCQASNPSLDPVLLKTIKGELAFLKENWPDSLPSGVIHADLFPDNVFFEQNQISGLIDFYFACFDSFAYDIAICINAWCFDDTFVLDPLRLKALLEGYKLVRPLELVELTALPVLTRGAALRFLLTRLYDWIHHPKSAIGMPKDPHEYLARLHYLQKTNAFSRFFD